MSANGECDAAIALAETLAVDLRTVRWHDQLKFDPGRKQFRLEHVVPVNEIRNRCLRATSATEVAGCLAEGRVAWILRNENQRLNDLGFNSKRPDPAAAYRAAGISLAGLTYADGTAASTG